MQTVYSRDQRFAGSVSISRYEVVTSLIATALLAYHRVAFGEFPDHHAPLGFLTRMIDPIFALAIVYAHRNIYCRRRAFRKPAGWVLAYLALCLLIGFVAGSAFGLLATMLTVLTWHSIKCAERTEEEDVHQGF